VARIEKSFSTIIRSYVN